MSDSASREQIRAALEAAREDPGVDLDALTASLAVAPERRRGATTVWLWLWLLSIPSFFGSLTLYADEGETLLFGVLTYITGWSIPLLFIAFLRSGHIHKRF